MIGITRISEKVLPKKADLTQKYATSRQQDIKKLKGSIDRLFTKTTPLDIFIQLGADHIKSQ